MSTVVLVGSAWLVASVAVAAVLSFRPPSTAPRPPFYRGVTLAESAAALSVMASAGGPVYVVASDSVASQSLTLTPSEARELAELLVGAAGAA